MMVCKNTCVAVAKLLEKARGALDVREEESNPSGRQVRIGASPVAQGDRLYQGDVRGTTYLAPAAATSASGRSLDNCVPIGAVRSPGGTGNRLCGSPRAVDKFTASSRSKRGG